MREVILSCPRCSRPVAVQPDGTAVPSHRCRQRVPRAWARPTGSATPCPGCGSTTCPGYYKPDGDHALAH